MIQYRMIMTWHSPTT